MPDFDIMTAAQLNDWYEEHVGYRPQEDDPTMTDDELRDACRSYAEEAARQTAARDGEAQ